MNKIIEITEESYEYLIDWYKDKVIALEEEKKLSEKSEVMFAILIEWCEEIEKENKELMVDLENIRRIAGRSLHLKGY